MLEQFPRHVVFIIFLHFVPIEQHFPSRDITVDQPQSDGVATVSGPRWICSKPERQWCAWRPDGEKVCSSPGNPVCPSICLLMHFPSRQVLEPRFNVETMALLLNIPPNKTLLRRHLATHFNLLIGSEAQELKQECLENPDYTLLTATTKAKVTPEGFPSLYM